ncbi:ammonium transporter [Pimelobacter simplex]|uniref:Ammonium transporter n=1 Tax=Nocardioides simplex TaxID=2045 RepID=A0A0C5WZ09_NOCSI|nr:ammonium transporter [Pimelobacter simplex]AJR18573.1 Ammonium transporter [Pimelobacter simplex]MCG8153483.1 ammonium transporter [Pimelobacter simplex]
MPDLLPLAATPATAAGDTAWLLAAAALVLLMAPGLAFFYGGMVRSKSVLNMMMMVFGALAVVMVVWVLAGYSLAFGDDIGGGLLGDPTQYLGFRDMLAPDPDADYPITLFAAFQGLFAVITVGLIAGAIADRTRFGTWLLFAGLWTLLVYAPVAHWIFGGGWMQERLGALDFAGGTAVEINSGAAGLAAALVLGRRVGFGRDPMKPHNLTLVMVGAGLLWFGWFGFNAGSALAADNTAAIVFVNTLLAGCTGLLAWLGVERFRDGHATSFGAASGVVAGLVAITPSCGAVTPIGAMLVGVAAGAICALAVGLKYTFRYDDSLDVVGVHLVGGLVGTILIGLLASTSVTGVDGLFYGGGTGQLGRQLVAAGATLVFSFVMTALLLWVLERTVGFRVDPDHEVAGVDLVIHAETAYDLHATGGARPHFGPGTGTLHP